LVSAEELPALAAAELLADSFADIAGAAVRSVILYGSLSAGGFRAGRSDIDLLAVIDGGLADEQSAAVERLVRHADAGSAAGLDLHVVTTEVVGAPTRAPALELHVGRYDRVVPRVRGRTSGGSIPGPSCRVVHGTCGRACSAGSRAA
jgi:hypothetical protein